MAGEKQQRAMGSMGSSESCHLICSHQSMGYVMHTEHGKGGSLCIRWEQGLGIRCSAFSVQRAAFSVQPAE
jgi:hypothetical protein